MLKEIFMVLNKYAAEIEHSLDLALNGQAASIQMQNEERALSHLESAQNILANAGYSDLSIKVAEIIADYSDIEVSNV
jgi:hypothetical protein